MKRLRTFSYHEPESLEEAIETLAAGDDQARLLAGGTDLVVDMKTGRMRPSIVVNLKRIPGLSGIEAVEGGIRIGALTKVTTLAASPLVGQMAAALADAAAVLATPPVRRLATIGGNIGRASPASDLGPPLIVHEAVATIEGRDGGREEAVESLYLSPGATTLAVHDIITSIFVPTPGPGFGSSHLKIGARAGGTDIAMVGVSAGVALAADGRIAAARIVLASVAPTPLRAFAAERALLGREPAEEAVAAAAAAAAAESRPISDLRTSASHRVALTGVLTARALRVAIARANEVSR